MYQYLELLYGGIPRKYVQTNVLGDLEIIIVDSSLASLISGSASHVLLHTE